MIFQQLRLTIQRGLAYRLYSLYRQIKAIKSRLEVCRITFLTITQSITASQLAVDERQLAIMEGTSNTAAPSLAVGTHLSRYVY
jgi:hypothetical protein